jgi:uncharacterized protein YxeA
MLAAASNLSKKRLFIHSTKLQYDGQRYYVREETSMARTEVVANEREDLAEAEFAKNGYAAT